MRRYSAGVMVVGAGLAGVEVAGEIATRHPALPVKLVTSRPALGDGMPPAVAKAGPRTFTPGPGPTLR